MKSVATFFAFVFLFSLTLSTLPVSAQAPLTVNCQTDDKDGDGWVRSGDETSVITCTPDSGGTALKKKGGGDCMDEGVVQNGNIRVRADQINPGATDVPGNGIDEDCDGGDGQYTQGSNTDAEGVMTNIRNFLTWVVGGISGIVLIIGGIMYATAAGEEQKTRRARKAMLGAIVGLVVALLANVIIGLVATNVGG